jgi:hypothetical protein
MLSPTNLFWKLNSGVCGEGAFVAELCYLRWIRVFWRIVLSATNRCLLPNYGVCSEWAFVIELLCCLQQITVCCWIIVFAAKEHSLQNYSIYSESGVHYRILVSAANERSLSNCVGCSKSGARCRITEVAVNRRSLSNYVVCSELAFAAELLCL